ncbi:MAG: PQQ-binding-like beta-propeller repeat protein, partial [Phycisphaerae bacterium]|nr:PQQ-binding-like beta-propeller repeat protein [Phycisphaerae bacterium]
TVVGDDVIVNDGRSLTAFDRYTLAARWRRDFSLSAADASFDSPRDAIRTIHSAVRVEDAATVSAAEGVAVAAMGLLSQQLREGDNRLRAVEVATGRDLWALTPGEIADTLRLAEFRGPSLIDQSVAIQAFRKESAARRLASTYLAGLDLWTGRARWIRLIGSAGSLGSFGTRPGETPVAHEGIIYRADESGLISAIESVTGRVRWMRVIRNDLLMRASESSPPWASQAPVIEGSTLIALDPSQRSIHRYSIDDGSLIASRDTAGIPLPIHYLLAAGRGESRSLVCVSESQMAVLPMATFHVARPSLVPRVTEPGFRGRVVAMGDTIAAPILGGVLMVPVTDATNPAVRPLDHTGNIVASGGNLLVADAWRLHSYLAWEDADQLLSARIRSDPSDPRPALALCELAYRARRFDRIVPAADQALSALARDPRSPVAQQVRPRLFESLLEMVRSSTRAVPQGPQALAASVSPRIEDMVLVDRLVSRLERLADSPVETVQWLISLGSLRELQSNPVAACQAYQRILEDSRLAAIPWREESPPVLGATLAITRLRAVVQSFGPAAYEPFNAELERELSVAAVQPSPAELESLAARYPLATRTPELLTRAALGHRSAGNRLLAAASLERASEAAWFLVSVGILHDRAMLGEAVGAHARILAELGRPLSAVHVLQRAAATRAGMEITADGSPIDPGSLVPELRRLAKSGARAPIIGSQPTGDIDVIVGWSLVTPVLERDVSPAVSHEWAVMIHAANRRLGVFCDLGSGRLSPIWTRRYAASPPTVLQASPDQFIVLWSDDATVERIDPATGDSLWRSQPLGRILPTNPQAGVRIFDTPLDGQVRSDDIVAALNDASLVIAQRDGAAVRFDARTGRVTWTARLPLTRLYDLSLTGEQIAFSGAADSSEGLGPPIGDRREPRPAPKPTIAVLDTQTGRPAYDPIHPESDVRWIRSSSGVLIVALVRTIRGLDLATGRPVWEDIVGDLATHTAEGWVFDDSVYILSRRRELHRLAVSTGEITTIDLSTIDRLAESGEITAGRVGKNIGFSSRQGIFLVTPSGDPVGATTLSGRRPYMPAMAGRDVIALVESSTDELLDGRLTIRVTLVTADSAKLLRTIAVVVHGEPDTVLARLMDGRLILTTDFVTQVIPLPAPEEP